MAAYTQTQTLVSNINDTRRGIDVAPEVLEYLTQKNKNQFVVILSKANKKLTDTSIFYWNDTDFPAQGSKINNASGYAAGITALVVDDASVFVKYDIAQILRTGEQILITDVNTGTNTLTVTRGYGSTAAAAINDDDYIMNIGSAFKEGDSGTIAKNIQPVNFSNITMITKTKVSLSGTTAAENMKAGGNERIRLRQQAMLEHALKLEKSALLAEKKSNGVSNVTSGIIEQIGSSNVYTVADGTFAEADMEAYCEKLFAYGSGDKVFVAAPHVIGLVNAFAANKLQTSSKDETYGMNLQYYQSTFGRLYLVQSKILTQAPLSYMGLGLDMDYIAYRPLRDTKLFPDVQANGTDGFEDEFLTEWGIEVRLKNAHCVLKNAQN